MSIPSWHPLYARWHAMIQRCESSAPRYGGRGIQVCDRWKGSQGLENFVADMGSTFRPGYELDRKNNDGPYCPSNTQWLSVPEHEDKHHNPPGVELAKGGDILCQILLSVRDDEVTRQAVEAWEHLKAKELGRVKRKPRAKKASSAAT